MSEDLTYVRVPTPDADIPGMWLDGNNIVHFCLPMMLDHCGLPRTPEKLAAAAGAVADMREIKRAYTGGGPQSPVIVHIQTFVVPEDGKSIICLYCMSRSYNSDDVRNRYCGHCHKFHEP